MEVVIGAGLGTLMTSAVGPAAGAESFDARGAEGLGRPGPGAQQGGFARPQGQRGLAAAGRNPGQIKG